MEAVLFKRFSFLPKGLLLAENIKGSSAEINVKELSSLVKTPKNCDILQGRDTRFRTTCFPNPSLPCVHYGFCFCFLIKTKGSKDNVEKPKMQYFYIVLVSCYLQEEKIQITKIFTTCVKKWK